MKFITLLFSLVSLSAFAAEGMSQKSLNELKLTRDNFKYSLNLSAGKELGTTASGIELNIFKDGNSAIYVKYMNMYPEYLTLGFETQQGLKLGMKKFTGKTFNYKYGVYLLNTTTRHHEKTDSDQKQVELSYNEFGAFTTIGNQWQTKYLTTGVDWIGLNGTLYEFQKYEKPFTRTSHLTITLLNVYLGYSF